MHTKDSLSTEQLGTHEDISPSALPCALLITGVLVFCIYDNREWFTHTLITTLSSFVIACLTVFLAYDTRKSRIAMYKQAIKPMLNLQLIRDNSICYLC